MNLWTKAKNLILMKEAGYNIPPFYVISPDQVELIHNNSDILEAIISRILWEIQGTSYAVRSSASCEDGDSMSFAWQFHTELAIPPTDLSAAIQKTIEISYRTLGEDESLSLIIQEYKEAQYSGVCFSRNPRGDREYVIEYHEWRWIDLVSWNIIPKKIVGYWDTSENISIGSISIDIFLSLEQFFGAPQDIEWCISDGELFILQSRPVTTISNEYYAYILEIEAQLNEKKDDYCFQKWAISDAAPRPTPFTLSLLHEIYAENGPVQKAYADFSIEYIPWNILHIFWNELYVDTDAETKTLLPSYSFSRPYTQPRLSYVRWLFSTIKNLFFLTRIHEKTDLEKYILDAINRVDSSHDFLTVLWVFLEDYRYIFSINLLASSYVENLRILLWKDNSHLSTALSLYPVEYNLENTVLIEWNSLEISDITPFERISFSEGNRNSQWNQWLSWFPEWKKWIIEKSAAIASKYTLLREYGRVLMLKNLSHIRNILLSTYAPSVWLSVAKDIYWASIPEIKNMTISQNILSSRKENYLKYNQVQGPRYFRKYYTEPVSTKNTGISRWVAIWILVNLDEIHKINGPKILLTENLSPDLFQYFDSLVWIVSRNGWYLSHLAILAREKNFPIIISNDNLILEQEYSINGETWEIKIP